MQQSLSIPVAVRAPDPFEAAQMQRHPEGTDLEAWRTVVVPCLEVQVTPMQQIDGSVALAVQAKAIIPAGYVDMKVSKVTDAQGNAQVAGDGNPLFPGPGCANLTLVVRKDSAAQPVPLVPVSPGGEA